MEIITKLYKDNKIEKLNISDTYKALIYLYFRINKVFFRDQNKLLRCKYDKLNNIYILIRRQEELMKHTDTPLFKSNRKFPYFNEEVEFDKEYYILLENLIINDDEYTKIEDFVNEMHETVTIIKITKNISKNNNQYAKLLVKSKNGIKTIYCFKNVDEVLNLVPGTYHIKYTIDKYYKLKSIEKTNVNCWIEPTDIII